MVAHRLADGRKQQLACLADAAADYDDLWVEEVQRGHNAQSDDAPSLSQQVNRQPVAMASRRADHPRIKLLRVASDHGEHGGMVTSYERLSGSARDRRPRRFLLNGRHLARCDDDGDMPQLSRQASLPGDQPSITDDARADAGADCDIADMSTALRRALRGFCQRRDIGVVADVDGQSECCFDNRAQRHMMPAGQIGRRNDYARLAVEWSGRRDADAVYLVAAGWHNQADDGFYARQDRCQAVVRACRHVFARQQIKRRIVSRRAQLCPAQVYGDYLFFHRAARLLRCPASLSRLVRADKIT